MKQKKKTSHPTFDGVKMNIKTKFKVSRISHYPISEKHGNNLYMSGERIDIII